jgi:hypothetical protein
MTAVENSVDACACCALGRAQSAGQVQLARKHELAHSQEQSIADACNRESRYLPIEVGLLHLCQKSMGYVRSVRVQKRNTSSKRRPVRCTERAIYDGAS